MRPALPVSVFLLLGGCQRARPCVDLGTVGPAGAVRIARGTDAHFRVDLASFSHPVEIDAVGLPQGITFNGPVTVAVGNTSADLVLHSSSSATLGQAEAQFDVAVCGRSLGETVHISVEPHGGAFDPTFGANGHVFIDAGGDGDSLQAAAIDSAGRLVVAGSMGPFAARDMAVTRLLPDGTVDPTFGIVDLDFGGIDVASSLSIQPDGRILIGGSVDFYFTTGGQDLGFARLEPDGSLDPSFGTGGKALVDLGGNQDIMAGMTLDAEQRVVTAGTTRSPGGDTLVFLARLTTNGSIDTSYGASGSTVFPHPEPYSLETAGSFLVDPDGVTTVAVSTSLHKAGLLRATADGALDPTFGAAGWSLAAAPPTETNLTFRAVARHSDGTLWAVGGDDDFVVARFDDSGTMVGGFQLIDAFGFTEQGNAISIRDDGSVFLVGEHLNAQWYIFEVVDLLPDGALDESFGGPEIPGILLSALEPNSGLESANAVILHGNVLYVAGSRNISGSDFAVASYFQSLPR